MLPHVQTTPILNTGTAADKRQEIRDYFSSTWELYERLFDVMTDDDAYYLKADPLRHPLIFYLGHTATFFVNKLMLARLISKRVDPHFESLFAIGVDEMSWDDINKNDYQWPRWPRSWPTVIKSAKSSSKRSTRCPFQCPSRGKIRLGPFSWASSTNAFIWKPVRS